MNKIMKTLALAATFCGLGITNTALADGEANAATPVAVWEDFHTLTSVGYTWTKTGSDTVGDDGSLTIGSNGGLSMSFSSGTIHDNKLITVIIDAEVPSFSSETPLVDITQNSCNVSLTSKSSTLYQRWNFDGRDFGSSSWTPTTRQKIAVTYKGVANVDDRGTTTYLDGTQKMRNQGLMTYQGNITSLCLGKSTVGGQSSAAGMKIYRVAMFATNLSDAEVAAYKFPSELLNEAYLWLDASDSATITKDSNGVVTRWASRNASGKAATSYTTSPVTGGPTVSPYALGGKNVVDFGAAGSNKDLEFARTTNVRAVFMVAQVDQNNNVFLLGDSSSFNFHRGENSTVGYYFSENNACNALVSGTYRNGVKVGSPRSTVIPNSYGLISILASDNVAASRICQDRAQSGRNGGKRVAELIVLTQAIGDAERTCIENYLTKKWMTGAGEPTISLGFDNGQAASAILGGSAPTSISDWDSNATYAKVRDSDSNYAMTINLQNPTARPNKAIPSGFSDSTSWSAHIAMKLTETANGVLFGFSDAVHSGGNAYLGLEYIGSDKVKVVYGTKNAGKTTLIDNVSVPNATTKYHSYLLTFDASASTARYKLYIDGVKGGDSGSVAKKTGYAGSGSRWCVGNYYGGATEVGGAIFTGAQVDDFAIWATTCLTAEQAAKVAESFPVSPDSPHVATISQNSNWRDLEWSAAWPAGGRASAMAALSVDATSTLTFSESETMSKLTVTSDKGKDLTIEKSAGKTVTVSDSFDFSGANGKVTVGFDTGAISVKAGKETELKSGGSGVLAVGANSKVTVIDGDWAGSKSIDASSKFVYGGTAAMASLCDNTGATSASGIGYTIAYARPVTSTDGVQFYRCLKRNFEDGFSMTTSQFVAGNKVQEGDENPTQYFVQNGGAITVTGSGEPYDTGAAVLLGHWSSKVYYTMNGGTFTVEKAPIRLGWDGQAHFTVTGGTFRTKGIRSGGSSTSSPKGRNNTASFTLSAGTLELGDYGIQAVGTAAAYTFSGGTVKAYANTSIGVAHTDGVKVSGPVTFETPDELTMDVSSKVTGSGSVTKTGTGTLTFSGANTYSGTTTVSAGTLKFGAAPTAAPGMLTVEKGATLDLNGIGNTSEANNFVVTLNGGTIDNTTSTHSGLLKSLTLTADSFVSPEAGKKVSIQNQYSGSGATTLALGTHTLTQTGGGVFRLVTTTVSGTGTIDVQNGQLLVQESSNFGDAVVKVGENGTFATRLDGTTAKKATIKYVTGDGGQIDNPGEISAFTLTGTAMLTGNGTWGTITLADGAVADVDTRHDLTFAGTGSVKAQLTGEYTPGSQVTICSGSGITISELRDASGDVIDSTYYTSDDGVVTFKNEAKVGEDSKFTLAQALTDATDDATITLLADATLASTATLNANATLVCSEFAIDGEGSISVASGKTLGIAAGVIGVDLGGSGSFNLTGGFYKSNTVKLTGDYRFVALSVAYKGCNYEVVAGSTPHPGDDEKIYTAGDEGTIIVSESDLVSKGYIKSGADVQDFLDDDGANEIPNWKNVVLGLSSTDPAAFPYPMPVQGSDASKVGLKLGDNVTVDTASGATVTYKVMKGSGSSWETLETVYQPGDTAQITLESSGVMYYKFDVTVTPAK